MVYPVGVTTYWCYFLQIIIYNFVTIYGIVTKFGIRMHPYLVYQISRQSDNAFVFYDSFHIFSTLVENSYTFSILI